MAGAEVRARRAPAQPVGEQRADVGELERRAARPGLVRRTRASTSSSRRWSSRRCQDVALARGGERVGGARRSRSPSPRSAWRRSSASTACLHAVDELGEPAGEVDRAAVDVVERQHAPGRAAGPPRSSRRRPASGRGPRRHVLALSDAELERLAVRGVEPPADPARRRPTPASATGRRRRSRSAGARARGRPGRAAARRSRAGRRARAAG